MTATCRICTTSDRHETFLLRERMFGWGDTFTYFKCSHCGCLQILTVPADLERYYPPNYYSFHLQPVPQSGWKPRLAAIRDFGVATNSGLIGRALAKYSPARLEIIGLGRVPLRREMKILDVGCGRGQLLTILHRAGFSHLLGVDPYLKEDIEVLPGLRVLKQDLTNVDGVFDFIMLHHVFEHIEDGLALLKACRQRLARNGLIMLRFPTATGEAWERYGEHWVQLDPPRHLVLHTAKSLEHLTKQAGLQVIRTWYDSTEFQFIGSELYLKNLPLVDSEGQAPRIEDHFTPEQVRRFAHEAAALNSRGRGDQMVALLTTPPLGSKPVATLSK